jgi:hypothetical protein
MSWKVPDRSKWINKPPSLYQRFVSLVKPAAAPAAPAAAAAAAPAAPAAAFPTVNAIIQKANAKAALTLWDRNDNAALKQITAASAATAAAAGAGAEALKSRNISKLQAFERKINGASNQELETMNSALVHANRMGLQVNDAVARQELQAAAALNAVKGRHNKLQEQVDKYLNNAHGASPEEIEEMRSRLVGEAAAGRGGRRRNTRHRNTRRRNTHRRNKKTHKSRR